VSISSAFRRAGLGFAKHRDFYGVDSPDTLVLSGTSQQFNPTLDPAVIEAQRKADPTAARSEWDSEFRNDLAEFLSEPMIESSTDYDRPLELPPRREFQYFGFVDASGGSGWDAYTIAVAHMEGDRIMLDFVRGTPRGAPFNPQEVTRAYAKLCHEYRLFSVVGNYYAAQWVASAWQDAAITYQRSPITKSQIYLEALPLFAREMVRLPNHPILLRELRLLERRTLKSGRDAVDHGSSGHDDYANSTCGALVAVNAGAAGHSLEVYMRANDDPRYAAAPPALLPEYEKYAAAPAWFPRDLADLCAGKPMTGPRAPGSLALGSCGYRAATAAERAALGLDELAAESHRGQRPRNLPPI
jgi:hypothetical protein